MTFSVDAVDAHCEGQPGRVVVGGVGRLAAPGASMFEKMKYFEQEADWFRLMMLREPRGYPRSCVNVLLPPTNPRADAGFIIMEQSALYAAMSGTNLMNVTTVLLETGMLEQFEPVTTLQLEVPAGLIQVQAHCAGGRVGLVEFENVPSFATAVDVPVKVEGFGTVPVSVAWGGMACAVVDAAALGLELEPSQARAVGDAMVAVCEAAREQIGFHHPTNDEFCEIEATVVIGRPHDVTNHARQTAGIPTGQMDTSPSGTGTSAGMAVQHARGTLMVGEEFRTEGLLGGLFRCSIVRETRVGELQAIVPQIGGRSWITGYARYVLQDDDPFPEGFTMGDLWPAANMGSTAERLATARRPPAAPVGPGSVRGG
jgi:proline racemase